MLSVRALIITIVLNCLYIFIGGGIFHAIEYENKAKSKNNTASFVDKFAGNRSCVSRDELEKIILQVVREVEASDRVGVGDKHYDEPTWHYMEAVFFSATVVSTIGYGHLAPSTVGGQIFFIFYAIIGIPLCLLMFSGIGEYFMLANRAMRGKITSRTGSMSAIIIVSTLVTVVGSVLYTVIPAAFFSWYDGWSFLESLYFSVTTLSTVGFGDFLSGSSKPLSERAWYRVLLAIWAVLGISWYAGIVKEIQKFIVAVEEKIGPAQKNNKKVANDNSVIEIEETTTSNGDVDVNNKP